MNRKALKQLICCFLFYFFSPFPVFAQDPGWQLLGFPRQEVEQVVVDPIDDHIVYVGLWLDKDTTEVYKSYDRGEHWTPLSIRNKWVSSIAIDPKDHNRIYIAFWNLRPLRSEDGGLTWIEMPLGSYWDMAFFTIDPTHTNIVYYVHTTSPESIFIHKSTDYGANWQEISPEQWGYSLPCPVVVNPKNSDVVYAKSYNLFKSTDQGLNWSMIDYEFANIDFVFLHQEHPETVYVADPALGSEYKKGRLLISHDGGINWFEKGPFNGRIEQIISDRTNANVIYIPAGKEIVKSIDAGMTWDKIENGFLNAKIWSIALSHDGHILYAATDSGLYKKDLVTSIGQKQDFLPADISLWQNYPNPFNPTTRIMYQLQNPSHVSLHIYNMQGELVRTLINADQQAQNYFITWDGKNDSGQPVVTGIYFCRLHAGAFNKSIRLVLLR